MSKPVFAKKVISELVNPDDPGAMNTFSNIGDINRDGFIDYAISGRNGTMVWLENQHGTGEWKQHLIDAVKDMECGGSIYDLTGDGYPDIINGGDYRSNEVNWWQNPGEKGGKWIKRLIAKTAFGQFHDTLIGDVTNDGTVSLIFTNQQPGSKQGTNIYRIPLPEDPAISPWPGLELIAGGRKEGVYPEEGLAIADIDGDGLKELVCGSYWYKYTGKKENPWEAHKYASGYVSTVVAAGDIDGDGRNEIVVSEGDAMIYGKPQGGRLAYFKPGKDIKELWEEHVLDDGLLDPHSLQLGDLCGNGRLDIFVGEIGACNEERDEFVIRPPRLMVYENDGKGAFIKHIIDEGTGIHCAQLVDLNRRGMLDIIGKPLHGPERWKIIAWYRNMGK